MFNILERIIYKCANLYWLSKERNNWYRDFSHFRDYTTPVLSESQKKEAKAYFNQFGLSLNTDWHNYYTFMTGEFSTKYIPADLMYTVIVPYLNYMPFELAYQDKGIYGRLLPMVRQPKCIIQRIHGFYYKQDYLHPITQQEAISECKNLKDVIIKPTVDSCQGNGVKLISITNGITGDNVSVKELFQQYGDNFIIQERVKQHEFLASLNNSSLNTMRILTLRVGNEVVVLSKAIRVGGKGSITDNGYGGGFCTGILDDGTLKPHGYRLTTGDHIDTLQNGIKLEGLKIPHFEKVIAKAKELAMTLPYLRIIGWDFSIDEEGEPVFIEMNTLPGIYMMQLCNGPVFGEYTDSLLESVKTVTHGFRPKFFRSYKGTF